MQSRALRRADMERVIECGLMGLVVNGPRASRAERRVLCRREVAP